MIPHPRAPLRKWLTIALLGALSTATQADHTPYHRVHGGLDISIGLMPGTAIRAIPGPERTMHSGGHHGQHHLVVALFDPDTGRRIVDARVTASVGGLDLAPADRQPLQAMRHGDLITYGGFFYLPPGPHTAIALEVERPGREKVTTRFDFCPACRP